MKLSLHWINDFIDIQKEAQNPADLAALLTRAGLEVESISDQKQQFQSVVVGHILEKNQHPSADRLSLCKVDVGAGEALQIVCGAQNHKAGDKVVAALVGAVLPGNFKIQKSKIRGVESMGMLCSAKELGLSADGAGADGEGILILDPEAKTGMPFSEYEGLNDVILELKVTPNRADCLSHYGLARELSLLLQKPMKLPDFSYSARGSGTVNVQIEDPINCLRYAGCVVENIEVAKSPSWMKSRLENSGFKSINSIVDITNYVMLELGQPMHAFDLSQLTDQRILVRKSYCDERFESLDGTNINLAGGELLICDRMRPVALAGVVGGKNSGIQDSTKNIFLESACFAPQSVRRTSRLMGIQTESAYRFSRGVDPSISVMALQRALQLIQQLHPDCKISNQLVDSDHREESVKKIEISMRYLSQRLGYEAKADVFENYLKLMGCSIQIREDVFIITPPEYRVDLEQAVDFVEEYARLYGYEHIPENLPVLRTSPTEHDPVYLISRKISHALRGMGLDQAINSSFAQLKGENEFVRDWSMMGPIITGNQHIGLLNPLTEDQSVMRRSLSYGLFSSAKENIARTNLHGGLFEIGKVFGRGDGYAEKNNLAMIKWGQDHSFWVNKKERPLFHLKKAFEEMMIQLGLKNFDIRNFEGQGNPAFLHPFQSGQIIFQGKTVGFFGHLHPQIATDSKIRQEMALLEVDLEVLLSQKAKVEKVQPLSKFPAVERDLAFVVSKKVSIGDMIKELKKIAGQRLMEIHVFDLFEGESLGKDVQSAAFRMKLQDQKATLTDEELLILQNQMIEKIQKKFDCRLR